MQIKYICDIKEYLQNHEESSPFEWNDSLDYFNEEI